MGRVLAILAATTAISLGSGVGARSETGPINAAFNAEAASENASSLPAAEVVNLQTGKTSRGLIESQDALWIRLIQVERPAGLPPYLIIRPISRQEVRIVPLGEGDRKTLREDIERFHNRAEIEAMRKEAVSLATVTVDGNTYRRYQGRGFTLDTTAVDEPDPRELAVRADQIFAAYRQILAPRTAPKRPLRVIVFGSIAQYRTLLAQMRVRVQSSACFIEKENLVAVGSDLADLGRERDRIHDRIQGQLRLLQQQKKNLQPGAGRNAGALKVITAAIAQLRQRERENNEALRRETRLFFNRLYHEAFHAYIENFVYPHEQYAVPFWLNEGLAVMYERGLLEGSTLRVDSPNRDMLALLRDERHKKETLPLRELLTAGPDEFVPRSVGG